MSILDEQLADYLEPTVKEWKAEWQGMPEFEQGKRKPYSTIVIRCATKEDLADLSQRLGQKLTSKTKSIWHPPLYRSLDELPEQGHATGFAYEDEDEGGEE